MARLWLLVGVVARAVTVVYWTDTNNTHKTGWTPHEERLGGLVVVDGADGSIRRVQSNSCRRECEFKGVQVPRSAEEAIAATHDADVLLVSAKLLRGKFPLSWIVPPRRDKLLFRALYWRETSWAAGAWETTQLEFDLLMGVFFTSSILNPSFFPLQLRKPKIDRKDRFAVFVSSHCGPQPRTQYLAELRRYVQVDEFGACRGGRRSNEIFASRYKFWLCFENSIANGYVSEKLLRNPLIVGAVPVYLGAPDVGELRLFGEDDWFIDASRFRNPRQLADYLEEVGSDETRWRSYFKWHDKISREQPFDTAPQPVRDAVQAARDNHDALVDADALAAVTKATFQRNRKTPLIKDRVAAMCRLCDLTYLDYLRATFPLTPHHVTPPFDAMRSLGLNTSDLDPAEPLPRQCFAPHHGLYNIEG
ncbi:hypothetical protein CTAYLR_001389 [Chrysophaeum taylorii]|uniref:Fucosyltransferase n=1 Tax=Chrysophaeum taylorii TaxID=2483200 RepID=A0AAD7U666_9STRA|nr:hypothetical protein CTAYLR_001389 [Chrysophaeum taylorii]